MVSDGQADPVLGEESTPGLDLEGCTLDHDLALLACRFEHAPVLLNARVQSLFLNDAALPGLVADGLEARGGVFLRGVQATGEVRLLGARIGGNLDCEGARFENAGGKALTPTGSRRGATWSSRRSGDGRGAAARGADRRRSGL